MKELSKKQKLIGGISIILVAVILAIVITINIINSNNQRNQIASQEEYLATTANAGSTLVASYIKKGITIGGITGTLETLDTSDATAVASDIAKGKVAYARGERIVGTYVENTLGTVTGNETTNSEVNDKYGNPVKVPAGFKVVNPDDDVTNGIVIEDVNAGDENTEGSQFVWIPVGDVITDNNGNTTTINLNRYNFYSTGTVPYRGSYTEDTAESHNSSLGNAIAKDIEDFIEKVNTSHGYYIGRYEAGDATATTSARRSSSPDTNPIVSKPGVFPYNYITQPQASKLSQEMYSNSNFESDLINSYAWDTTLVFIQTFSGDTEYGLQIGLQFALARCGEATDGTNNDIRCNIYDMAGNTEEWSTETEQSTINPCILRGGSFSYLTTSRAGTRGATSTDNESSGAPRVILYL